MKRRWMAVGITIVSLLTAHSAEVRGGAYYKEVNIVATFGDTEVAQYGMPTAFTTRYAAIGSKVAGPFSYMGLKVNFNLASTGYVCTYSPIETCAMQTGNFNAFCSHATNANCSNDGPYHETNAAYNRTMVYPRPRPVVDGIETYITATRLCYVDDGSHGGVYGMKFASGQLFVRDYDYTKTSDSTLGDSTNVVWVSATMMHELGHVYGAVDHYDTKFNNEKDDCVWGYNKNQYNVANSLSFCSDCYDAMVENIRN